MRASRERFPSAETIVELPGGGDTKFSGSGSDFLNLAPQPRESPSVPNLERMRECIRSHPVEFLCDGCVTGRIEPF